MAKKRVKRTLASRKGPRKVARLYHFGPETVQQIEFLSTVFGGKERGIAAAVAMAATVLKGVSGDGELSIR